LARRNPPAPLPPLNLVSLPRFVKDLKRQEKRQDPDRTEKLFATIELLRMRRPLPSSYRNHLLRGKWKGCQECHVGGEGDLLLVYKRRLDDLILVRTGKHDEIFQ
jgi:mRNA interferase YafQ